MRHLTWIQEDAESTAGLGLSGEYDKFAISCRAATIEEIELEEIADLLDQNAESCNAHAFVFAHRAIAALLFHELGRETATRIMIRLAGYEGLYGMLGVCGKGDPEETEKDLGVQLRDWSSWKLPGARMGDAG